MGRRSCAVTSIFCWGPGRAGCGYGNIVATVESGCVVGLSHSCRVEGEIRVPNVVIDGTVAGNVYSSERIELSKNGSINGNVYSRMIEMKVGAEVNGSPVHVSNSSDPKLSSLYEPERDPSTALLLDKLDSHVNQAYLAAVRTINSSPGHDD